MMRSVDWQLAATFLMAIAVPLVRAADQAEEKGPRSPTPAAEARPDRKGAFLWLRTIDGFNAIDDEHIVLNSGRRRALVTTFGTCFGLRQSETIALDTPLPYLDESGLGHILYRRSSHDRGRCPISHIKAVESLQEARELVKREKADKAAREKTPSP